MNSAVRAIVWHHELYLLQIDNNNEAIIAKFDGMVATLLAEDDLLVTVRTLRTLMASPSLPKLYNLTWKSPTFRKWITSDSTNILNFTESIDLKPYTAEEVEKV
jgi:hypothetical protein